MTTHFAKAGLAAAREQIETAAEAGEADDTDLAAESCFSGLQARPSEETRAFIDACEHARPLSAARPAEPDSPDRFSPSGDANFGHFQLADAPDCPPASAHPRESGDPGVFDPWRTRAHLGGSTPRDLPWRVTASN